MGGGLILCVSGYIRECERVCVWSLYIRICVCVMCEGVWCVRVTSAVAVGARRAVTR